MNLRLAVALLILVLPGAAADRRIAPYETVEPVLRALEGRLPPGLEPTEASWEAWARKEDVAIRARLEQGDLDSMVNLLLFGTSFTKQPRISIDALAEASKAGVLRARLLDFLDRIQSPRANERFVFLRQLLLRKGLDPGAKTAGVFVLDQLQRVLQELRMYSERAREPGAPEFAARSRLFRDRGISLDTSLLPNFGVEETLRDIKAKGLLAQGSVNRVAVIGPGLDFADWDEGYDFYPQQTLQPFALYASLVALQLADGSPAIHVLDISPRVLEHLRAHSGGSYTIQLPRDLSRPWRPEVLGYWQKFGEPAARTVAPIRPSLPGVETRAVRFPQSAAVEPQDLNIVVQRLDQQFDLVVATNVLVYYDTFQQALALQNVAAMLKPGGFLLVNSELPELASVPMRVVGTSRVRYADREGAGDTFLWYRRQ